MIRELFNSCLEYLKTRLKTPVYGVFTFWWVALNWEFFYTLIFINEQDILFEKEMLKNEYLRITYFNYEDPLFWVHFCVSIVVAILFTYLFIWFFPKKVLISAFRAQRDHSIDKQIYKKIKERELAQAETTTQQQEVMKLDAEKEKIKKEKTLTKTQEQQWQEDYEVFKKTKLYKDFHLVLEAVYEYGGSVSEWNTDLQDYDFNLGKEILAYIDTNGLVEYDSETISLTKKGKFFVKQYNLEKSHL